MDKIIRLNKKYTVELTIVDFESEHQGDRKNNITKQDMKIGIKNRFDKGHEIFFGYKHNNELIGYATLKPFFPGYNHCEMYWLAVKKKYQKQGIGTKLIKYIENYANKQGFRKIYLYTGKDMKDTRSFYEKRGYNLVNEFPDYYGYKSGNKTAVLYCKKL
ncbi:GNAT family N-acetyltransferase [Candidatus Woesearchaeota archaeon]|nr:GNAT family N-acetyltransferase [Candidatus Woesearchaeota archaeon]